MNGQSHHTHDWTGTCRIYHTDTLTYLPLRRHPSDPQRHSENETGERWSFRHVITVEPPNNGRVGDECFVHSSEVVPSSEVLTCIQLLAGGTRFVHCTKVVRSSECPLSEVPCITFLSSAQSKLNRPLESSHVSPTTT